MGPRRSVPVLLALALVAATLGSADATTRRDGHFDGQVATTTDPGAATTVTANLSNDVRSADVFMENDAGRTQEDFKLLVFVLMKVKTKTNRLVACAAAAADQMDTVRELLSRGDGSIPPSRIESYAGSRGAAYALMCMNIARLMAEIEAEGPPARPAARRSQCDVLPVKVKVRTERTDDGGYHLVPVGDLSGGAKALPVKTTCKGTGTRLNLKVVPKKKGSLKKAVGKDVVIGVANPPAAEHDALVTVGFRGH